MAKIGILTFHHPSNFGANLQAYSNYLYLTSLGHTVKIIDFIRETDLRYSGKVCKEQFESHAQFVKTHLPLTKSATTVQELKTIVADEHFDIIAIGADAVWSKSSNKEFVYFAKWVCEDDSLKNIKIVSLSAACMGGGYTRDELKIIGDCLNNFSHISVRDRFTKAFASKCSNRKDILINPDPVFLLSSLLPDDWLETDVMKDKKYVLMTLDKDWIHPKQTEWFKQFKKYVHQQGYKLVELPLPEGVSGQEFDYTVPYPIDPIQWFQTIRHAKGFIGLRFHSIVSCISNGVPFISLDTYGFRTSLINRMKYNLKLYPIIQPFEKMSKIRNLLKGSGFETYRYSTSPTVVPANKMVDKILKVETNKIFTFRDEQAKIFKDNIHSFFDEK